MTLRYLLDTNVIAEPLRSQPNEHLLSRLETYQAQLAIAAVVWHELHFSYERLAKFARRTAIGAYLRDVVSPSLPILPYDATAAVWHAAERARLAGLGQTPPFVDGQIAAVAVVNELTLVTANTTDFAHFSGLQVENWLR